jgi:hypothetical protein
METTRANRPITDAPATGCPSHLAGIAGGRPVLQGAHMSQDQRTRKRAVRPSQQAQSRGDEGLEAWKSIQADLRHERARDKWVGARKPTPPTKPIPKPLAAYRLGLLSNSLGMWHKVFFYVPEDRSTWDGVPLSVDQLREARLVLSDEIYPDIRAALDRVLDDLDDIALTLLKARQKTGAYQGVKFGTRRAPGVEQWHELRLLADRALPRHHLLRPWFNYGAAAGAYQLALYDHKPLPGPFDDLERLPDILPLVQQAGVLPDAHVRQIPLLHSLVDTVYTLTNAGQSAFLHRFIKRNRGAWGFSVERVDNLSVNRVGFILDDHVQHGLEHLEPDPLLSVATTPVSGSRAISYGPETAQEPPRQDLPEWDKENLRLRWKGEVVRKIRCDASDIILILDSFHELGWRRRIPNPLTGPPANREQKLDSAIDSLKCKLKMLLFHTARNCREIWWEPIQPD